MHSYLNNDRILLRAPEPEDLEVMYRIENDSFLWEISGTTTPYSRFTLKEYIETCRNDIFIDRQLRLMILHKQNKQIAGIIDLADFDPLHNRATVGIVVLKEYQGTGIASQALNLLCDYCFRFLHLKQLYAYIDTDNTSSIKLFKSCGFVQSGTLDAWIRSVEGYKSAAILQKIND